MYRKDLIQFDHTRNVGQDVAKAAPVWSTGSERCLVSKNTNLAIVTCIQPKLVAGSILSTSEYVQDAGAAAPHEVRCLSAAHTYFSDVKAKHVEAEIQLANV